MTTIRTTRLDCGAVLVTEPIESVASVAINWLLPIGSATDPADGEGRSTMLSELVFRGAGGLDSRAHSDALDRLGVQRNSYVTSHHLRLSATLVGDRLDETLPLMAAMVLEPALPESALAAVRSLCLQSLDGLDDDPQHLVMLRLRERHLPPPFNRHGFGRRDVLERCTIDQLREAWRRHCRPGGAILAAAGAVDAGALARKLDELFATWSGDSAGPAEAGAPQRGRFHLDQETAQMHIGAAWDAPREADPDSMLERLAVGVLSGGTSARLFTEVRQKRSLCYSVGASYRAGRDRGFVTLYAGTTPPRAQETLDVCLGELERLREGVSGDEFERAVVGLKSHLIMQGESTAARAAAIGADQFRLGHPRTLDELARRIDEITIDALNEYVAARQPGKITVASIGPGKEAGPLERPGPAAPAGTAAEKRGRAS